jgi:predicted DNA-binding mobile mystery protein A
MGSDVGRIILAGLDAQIGGLKSAKFVATPARGWLRAIREAVGLSQEQVAGKIAVKRQSYAQFEASEEKGVISLSSLRRAAEAMDCELVYFVVPKGAANRTFSDLARALDPLKPHAEASDHSMSLKADSSGP